jgi:ferredoxin/flavodoxin
MTNPIIPIYTLSGTGNTQAVATKMADEFQRNGMPAKVITINHQTSPDKDNQSEWIGIAAPVYGFGVSKLVFQFVKKLPEGKEKKVFICLTAGSGDNTTNRNAAGPLLHKLERKQYKVHYIRIFTMPSNWLVDYPAAINKKLYIASMEKASQSVNEIINGTFRKPNPSLIVSFLSPLMSVMEERIGAKMFGRFLKAGSKCIGCGKCARNCPAGNITLNDKRVRFGWKCIWCMKCIYQCPAKAIYARHVRFCVLKNSYNLDDVIKSSDVVTQKDDKKYEKFSSYFNNINLWEVI